MTIGISGSYDYMRLGIMVYIGGKRAFFIPYGDRLIDLDWPTLMSATKKIWSSEE